jgi:hypothetical protein
MKEQQQLSNLYKQRDQIRATQYALAHQSPPPYQTIHIEDQPESISHHQDGAFIHKNQRLQQLAQKIQHLDVCIQFQEDKLNAIEKEAMQWLQGTSQNEKREVKRTENGISAESTLKSGHDHDLGTSVFLGVATLALVAFVLNEIILFIKANPEVIAVGLVTAFFLFFGLKKFNKGQQ